MIIVMCTPALCRLTLMTPWEASKWVGRAVGGLGVQGVPLAVEGQELRGG